MAGGSRNTRSTQNNEEEELPEEEELSDEVYEGVTAYLAADKRLAAERNISKSIREALGTEDAKERVRTGYDGFLNEDENVGLDYDSQDDEW
ncbi:hypothetical protein NFJ02_32g82090 [Pycnococcus provasolii]